MPLLKVKDLHVHFNTLEGTIRAVQGVDFELEHGEILGIVGESGCGKSVTVRSILRLLPMPPGRIVSGEILFNGDELVMASNRRLREIRGGQISMIFQEPMTSLNPVFTIGHQIAESFKVHQGLGKKQAKEAAIQMLDKVRIPSPQKRSREYPHQLSGGMRQRVMIAMALACQPQIMIADEPTTALDVTIQAQILDLMVQLKEESQTSILLITHDLGVVAETAQRVIVMYAGKIVESGNVSILFENPMHPYTMQLLESVPHLGNRSRHGKRRLQTIPGSVPSLGGEMKGCWFAPRCSRAMDICPQQEPCLKPIDDHHQVRCWLFDK
ncbi:MAG: ABC transporter ATP-binding protein [Nitrospina sp.]|jgi:peptide/nickel transport system ATP-binding protein|nr:ABC transporter ATP-binding protein [Nitrospina sp.]